MNDSIKVLAGHHPDCWPCRMANFGKIGVGPHRLLDPTKPDPSPQKASKPTVLAPTDNAIQRRFEEFHAKVPDVYDWLVAAARAQKRKGRTRGSIALLWEHLRIAARKQNLEHEGYKFPNDFRSRYVRLMMEREPDLAGFFETRALTS